MKDRTSSPEVSTHAILANSDVNLAKKAMGMYLFPSNPARSERRHRRLGTPIVRRAIMGTIGRLFTGGPSTKNRFMG